MPAPPFPIPLEIPRVILGGGSAVDLEGVHLPTLEAARAFALNYGYDLSVPAQRLQVVHGFEEALSFLQEVILEGSGLDVPPGFHTLEDPLQLLVWASERPMDARARWSCVLLRVMHTIFHIDHNFILRFLPEIQAQVFARYDQVLAPAADGTWVLRGDYEVPVLAVERKQNKNRVSMLLKLLHKPENVAETIYDQIGIRLVAEDPLGVLEIVRFLLDHHVVMASHTKPSRARNRMFDLPALEAWLDRLPAGYTPPPPGTAARAELCRSLTLGDRGDSENPFSSKEYSAIQFTGRTLIRLPSPAVPALERLQSEFASLGRPNLGDLLHIPELIQAQDEFTFFFAHEVQVMDRAGFQNARQGPASHGEYKQRKLEAARKRVLQGILREEVPC